MFQLHQPLVYAYQSRFASLNRGVVLGYKPAGYTPVEYTKLIAKHHQLKDPIGFAGKLDPMAEGLMVLVTGNETKRIKSYQHLPKRYRAKVIIGLTSTTGDMLGQISPTKTTFDTNQLDECIARLPSCTLQVVPTYAGLKHQGKPLWWHARQGNAVKIERSMTIFEAIRLDSGSVEVDELKDYAKTTIASVKGDFFQEEALRSWGKIADTHLSWIELELAVSSGTYVRGIVSWMADRLELGMLVWKLQRTQVGPYHLEEVNETVVSV